MFSNEFRLFLTVFEITVFILLLMLYLKNRLQRKTLRNEKNKLNEILSTSPAGFFYFMPNGVQICSRRLAVLLGIYENTPSFEILLKKLSDNSQDDLRQAVEKLFATGKEFQQTLTTTGENIRLKVCGLRASTLDGKILAHVLWFQDETELLFQNEQYTQELQRYRLRDNLFEQALDGLPFALWLRNSDLSLAYCNKAYLKLTATKTRTDALKKNTYLNYDSQNKMGAKLLAIAAKTSAEEKKETGTFIIDKKQRLMQIHEVPMTLNEATNERFTMGFVQDIQNEETLKSSLENYLKAQYQVLGALNSGIVIFDANGYVQFYNKAFCDLWKLPEEWMLNAPSFAGILEKLREKRLLPEEGDFVKYKHKELELFSTLSTLQEDILYLPNGHIYKRMMNPYPLGGVVMTFDDVSDKVSLERLYNAQLANQQSVLNEMPIGILIFSEEGRLKTWNAYYEKLFNASKDFLQTEPLLMDVLDSQKSLLVSSDDIWDLMRPKILMSLEDENNRLSLTLTSGKIVELCANRLPDGGLLIKYI